MVYKFEIYLKDLYNFKSFTNNKVNRIYNSYFAN